SDAYTLNINTDGTINWQRGVGSTSGGNDDVAYAICKSTDGGYVIAGKAYETSSGSQDTYMVKLNGSGVPQWTKTIDGKNTSSADNDWVYSVIPTIDGGYAMAGYSVQYAAGPAFSAAQAYVLKVDGSGNYSWARHVGGGGDATVNLEEVYGIAQNTTDGTFLTVGYTGITGGTTAGGDDIYLVKMTSSGALSFTRTLGGAGDEYAW